MVGATNLLCIIFLAKYVLTDVVNNVVKETDAEHSQKELNQLSMPRQVK